MAANKITATFGADVSEVEAKMIQATRATKAYERAVKAIDGAKAGPDSVTKSLGQANEQMQKGLTLLKGGAITAGLGMVLGQMKAFAEHAKQMGDSATEAQKSAAKWGDEFKGFTDTIMGYGASALGTLAGWGRSIGEAFRDPADKAYDAVAESAEESAKRQEQALADLKAAHEKAAIEIPKLQKQLEGEQRETRLSDLSEQGRAMTEIYETEKAMAELAKQPKNKVTEAEQLRLAVELERQKRRLAGVTKKIREEEAQDAAQAAADAAKVQKRMEEEVGDVIKMIADEQKKADEDAIKRAKELTAERERAAKAGSEEARKKLGKELDDAGLSRGDDGKLRRGRVVVSDTDAARTISTQRRNAEFTAQARRQQIAPAGRVGGGSGADTKESQLLAQIRDLLKPRSL